MILLDIFSKSPEQIFYLFLEIVACAIVVFLLYILVMFIIVVTHVMEVDDENRSQKPAQAVKSNSKLVLDFMAFEKPKSRPHMKIIIEDIKASGFRPATLEEIRSFDYSSAQFISHEVNPKGELVRIGEWSWIHFMPDVGKDMHTTERWHIAVIKE